MTRSLTTRLMATAILLSAFGAAHAAAPTTSSPPPALKPVDAAKFYTGKWIEIARRPAKITDGCVAGATEYMPKAGGKLEVVDSCHDKTPDGKLKSISGPGKILDPGTNNKLHVSYRFMGFIPVQREFWVLDHDDAYSWFISASPDFADLWIYTRATRPDPALIETLKKEATGFGYDITKLEFPAQP